MADYHTVYKGPEGETTQWDDIQRKLGNLPPKPPVWKPEKYTPEADEVKDQDWIQKKDEAELEQLEDDFFDDRFLEEYRQRRIRELQQAAQRPRFGSVEPIRGSDFVKEVTHAGPDVWVVVHLYKDGHGPCTLMATALDELASQYPSTKFVKIVSTDCIPGYPDSNLPTLLLYNNAQCIKHVVHEPGRRYTPEFVALMLNMFGPFCRHGSDEDADNSQLLRNLVNRVAGELADRKKADDHTAVVNDEDISSDFEDS